MGMSLRRAQGYLALYRYVAEIDTVIVLAVRSQREAGYLLPDVRYVAK